MSAPSPDSGTPKKPQPLLARQRRQARTPAPSPRPSATPPAAAHSSPIPSNRGFRAFLRVAAIASLAFLGWAAGWTWRQTQVQGLVIAPEGYTLPREACVVRDFSGDLRALREEAARALAPYEEDLRDKEENLRRVHGDLSGLDERKRLYSQEIDRIQSDIQAAVSHTRQEADALWAHDGKALDAEYAAKMEEFRQQLAARAAQLKLSPDLDPKQPFPDIWVNSFRLSLYNPPPTVKAPAERTWLEQQLADWHAYEKEYDARRNALKKKADDIRQGLGGHLDGLRTRIDRRNASIADTDEQQAPLQSEAQTLESETAAVRTNISEQRKVYTAQVVQIPQRNVLEKLPLTPEGRFTWDHLEENGKYPPGNYLLWVPVRKGEEEAWAVVPFAIEANKSTDLIIKPGGFLPTDKVLQ
ncbi:MAG: hypothetical protein PW734_09005 [Verrucomicrobium sp.]|nr:hypothetical protein [Verrucomicrobium sp.]